MRKMIFIASLAIVSLAIQAQSWPTSTPEKEGLSSDSLQKADDYLQRYNDKYPDYHGLVIVRNGNLVFERYYNGFNKDSLNNLKSATKTFASLLLGIAIDKKMVKSEELTIGELFPEFFNDDIDENKKAIKLTDILSMTAGLEWDNDRGQEKMTWWYSKEPNKFSVQFPKLVKEPGTTFNYNSAMSHLLLGTVDKFYKKGSAEDFAKKYLLNPMGIKNYRWDPDSAGQIRGHSELYLRPRDMAKVGQLYLDQGKWRKKRIVSKEWLEKSGKVWSEGIPVLGKYGFQWWIRDFGEHRSIFAAGAGGQYIFSFPSLNMVIVTTVSWEEMRSSLHPFRLVENYLLKAVME